ncbi:LacI family DNA-binding transcriptional regulator [Brachybacterium sillae]|uniref:LacI family DNA-binding transcriptional regulator n=1 Tax=Brachybacterium sillae TaxID=2810536 RepID=UPI00217E919E|nr:LacI family DNA-binding transcriptional regulator [Brachybacterium sillae]
MKPRLVDIARASGVSEATVSRVLNGRGGVQEATRQKVLAESRRLGRDPAPEADTRPLVGIMVPDLENPVFPAWVERIEAELFLRGASGIVATRVRTEEREAEAFDRFLRAGARGIIVVSGFHAVRPTGLDHYRAVLARGVPLCMVNGVRPDLDGTFLSTDDGEAVRLALTHLVDLGHRRIGLGVGDEHTWPVQQKVRAFHAVAGDLDLEASPVAYTDFTYAGGYQAARELVGQGCTGMILGSDVMAAGALEGVQSRRLTVPGDVSVVGYDDIPWAQLTTPPLTTLRQAIPEISRAAVRAVLEGGDGSRRAPRSEFAVRPQLVVRGSTGAALRR